MSVLRSPFSMSCRSALTSLCLFEAIRLNLVSGHGNLVSPTPRQPEALYWYQVGCVIGCECSGDGKESYPDPNVLCTSGVLANATLPVSASTWNSRSESPRGDWNARMPWRSPGAAVVLDACGIASGFLPSAKVQYPHVFENNVVAQGAKGSSLPRGEITEWEAGSVVEASWHLTVNHGGGYQYRASKISENGEMSDDFEPLAFADDTHVVSLGSRKPFEIPATDVTVGVTPEGAAWRRLPIPACNCDSGSGCSGSKDDFRVPYSNTDAKPYGTCLTGLQFEVPHLTDGTWPEGYGYYVGTLQHEEYAKSPCAQHDGPDTCRVDAACTWYAEKNVCWGKNSSDKSKEAVAVEKDCYALKDRTTCAENSLCTWYESEVKKVCYHDDSKRRRSLESKKKDPVWHVTDKLVAPSEPGDYVLQWRWDNEQTPQVWTTCADIKVVEKGQLSSGAFDTSSRLVATAVTAAMMAVVVQALFF